VLIRFYFKNKDTGSKYFGQLTKEEEKKFKQGVLSRSLEPVAT